MAQTVRDGVQRFDQDGVAVLSIDNPPINAINVTVRSALYRMLDAVEGDAGIAGVVIASAGRLFSGGGDLREIGQAAPAGGPTMTELAHRIETFTKPVAVAIRGRAIGGGILLSLACHARLGAPDASIALPEVRLGFVPGAGGTQRLPRLVGIDPALEMIALAKSLDAPTARAAGFFDAIAERPEGLVDAAVGHVRAIAEGNTPWRRTSSLAVPVGDGDGPRRSADRYARLASEAFPSRRAPHAAIELVLSAVDLGFAEGLVREREVFEDLSKTSETRALLHLFFARSALGRSEAPTDHPTPSAPGSIRLVTSSRRPHAGIVEIVCTGNVDEGQLQAARDEAKAKRHVPVVVRGGSIIERLDAAYRVAAEALEQQGFSRGAINAAAAAEGLPPPFADARPGPVAAEPRAAVGLLRAFVEEARACFAAAMVPSAGAIDIIAVEACGFPATRGGPLFYADTLKAPAHVQ
jgi:enoyl-CoA hydratase/carnithine racemase